MNAQRCQECSLVKPKTNQYIRYDHLKLFYSRYSDDLLEHNYYFCENCSQFWREDDCSYPIAPGFYWKTISFENFIEWEGEFLPQEVEKSAKGIINWLNSTNGAFDVGLV